MANIWGDTPEARRINRKKMELAKKRAKRIGEDGAWPQSLIDEHEKLEKEIVNYNKRVEEKKRSREIKKQKRKKDEGCYISTAIMSSLNQDDDCAEIQLLREFRDLFLLKTEKGRVLVSKYYEEAPGLLNKINLLDNKNLFLEELYGHFLSDVIQNINANKETNAILIYSKMVEYIKEVVQN